MKQKLKIDVYIFKENPPGCTYNQVPLCLREVHVEGLIPDGVPHAVDIRRMTSVQILFLQTPRDQHPHIDLVGQEGRVGQGLVASKIGTVLQHLHLKIMQNIR